MVSVPSVLLPCPRKLFDFRDAPSFGLFGLDEVFHLAIQLHIFITRLLHRRRRWRLVRRDLHVAIPPEARAGGNQASHRHVLLQAAQVVDLARDRGFGEHARRFLETGRADERFGRQRRLGDAEQQRLRGGRAAAVADDPLVLFHEAELVHLLVDEELGVADVLNAHPPHHLARNHLDVLVVDVHALQAVDLLDFIDQVLLQLLLAQHVENVVRVRRTVHQRIAGADAVALLDVDVDATRDAVFARLAVRVVGHDQDLALTLDDAAVLDVAVDLADDCGILGLPRLEQFDHARQTARDVLRFCRFSGDLRQHVTGVHHVAVGDHHVGAHRHDVAADGAAVRRLDLDRRLLLLIRRVDHDQARQTRDFVEVFLDRDAVDDVLELDLALLLREDRERVRIPFDQDLAVLDGLTVLDLEARAVDHLIALAVAALVVLHHDEAVAVHDNHVAAAGDVRPFNGLQVVVLGDALVFRIERALIRNTRRRAADVERAHRQLRAGLADRLRGDDADGQPELDQPAGREVAAVAALADAAAGGAGQHRADLYLLDAGILDVGRQLFVDLLVEVENQAALDRVDDLLERDAADDAVAQRLDDLAAFDDGPRLDAVQRAAIVIGDDHVLRHVDETTRQVARVRRLQRGIGQALAGAVRRDEVLEHRQAFAEVGLDRLLDDFTGRLGHQAAHARQLAYLLLAAAGARVGHDVDGIELPFLVALLHLREHRVGDLLGDVRPHRDDLVVALAVGDRAFEVLLLDFDHLVARLLGQDRLVLRDDQVLDADRHARAGGVGEAHLLEIVEHLHGVLESRRQVASLHQLLQALLLQHAVHERNVGRQRRVQDHPADGRVDDLVLDVLHVRMQHVLIVAVRRHILQLAGVAQANRRQRFHFTRFERQDDVIDAGKGAAFTLRTGLRLGQVVAAEDDVLRRHRHGRAVAGRQDVLRRHHQRRRFDLRLGRERNVHGHLVAVEVGVERRADERVDADRLPFHQHRLERLDAEAMQRRRAVEQHRVLADHLFEHVPHFRNLLLHHLFGLLDGGDEASLFELVVDERLEQLERHLLRQAALVQLELGTNHDHRTAGVVDALAEQVLAEPALLALQRVAQRFERTIIGAAQHAAAAAVVEQRVYRFLEHALFVANDHVRRLELHQLLQPVVAVDDAAIEIVQVRRREAAAVERHQRTQLGRDHRDHVQDHPLRLVARLAEGVDHLQALGELQLLLRRGLGAHLLAQLGGQAIDADAPEQFLDRFRAHLRLELREAVLFARLAELILGEELVLHQLGITGIDHDIGFEIQHPLEITERDVEQVANAARQALEEPHVAHRRGELDVAEALAPHLGLRHFHAALVADHAAVLHALVLAAQALPVGDRAEDLGAEQAVALRLERAVVDRLRLGHLTERPLFDLVGRREADANRVEVRSKGRLGVGEARSQVHH